MPILSMGSRGGIPLPEGGKAEILQVKSDSALVEGLNIEVEAMIREGAKLVTNETTEKRGEPSLRINASRINVSIRNGKNRIIVER